MPRGQCTIRTQRRDGTAVVKKNLTVEQYAKFMEESSDDSDFESSQDDRASTFNGFDNDMHDPEPTLSRSDDEDSYGYYWDSENDIDIDVPSIGTQRILQQSSNRI